nr:tyrosine-type recombinase/integrase [Xanthobacter flavus]
MTACGQGKKVGGAVAGQGRTGARPARKRGRLGASPHDRQRSTQAVGTSSARRRRQRVILPRSPTPASEPTTHAPPDTAQTVAAFGPAILLLARLGLRASEVANLDFDEIDWVTGRITLAGKARREERLPLTQEIGDAILAYIERARPRIATTRVFLTDTAPVRQLSRIAVKCIVRRALDRAGVKSVHRGAHVLRHSAATSMLRSGRDLLIAAWSERLATSAPAQLRGRHAAGHPRHPEGCPVAWSCRHPHDGGLSPHGPL